LLRNLGGEIKQKRTHIYVHTYFFWRAGADVCRFVVIFCSVAPRPLDPGAARDFF
jgi:hypothetical protein